MGSRNPEQAVREAATICPATCKLTVDLLILKAVSESQLTWATSVSILVFLGLSVLDLGAMYATDRQIDRRQTRGRFNGRPLVQWLTKPLGGWTLEAPEQEG